MNRPRLYRWLRVAVSAGLLIWCCWFAARAWSLPDSLMAIPKVSDDLKVIRLWSVLQFVILFGVFVAFARQSGMQFSLRTALFVTALVALILGLGVYLFS